jgi:hypothetical protein
MAFPTPTGFSLTKNHTIMIFVYRKQKATHTQREKPQLPQSI